MNEYECRIYNIEENDNKIIDKIVENIIKIYNNNRNKNEKGEGERRRRRTEEVFNYIENSIKSNRNIILNDIGIDSFNFSLINNIDNNNKIKYILEYRCFTHPVIQVIKRNKDNKDEFVLTVRIIGRDVKIERTIEFEIMQDYYKNNNNKLVRLLKMENDKIDLKIIYNILHELFE